VKFSGWQRMCPALAACGRRSLSAVTVDWLYTVVYNKGSGLAQAGPASWDR